MRGLCRSSRFNFFLGSCSLFGPYYSLSLVVEDEGGGKITVSPDQEEYAADTIVSLTAEADDGWVFKSWSGVTTDDGSEATVLMNMNRKVTAIFEPVLKSENSTDNIIVPPSVDFAPSSEDSWTFMVYMDADNNLDSYSVSDFNEMEEGLELSGNTDMNIIVLYDRWEDGTDWHDSRLYHVLPDATSSIVSERLYPVSGTIVMSEGARSIDASLTAPESPEASSRLICQDENTGGSAGTDYLFTDELQQAIQTAVAAAPFPSGLDLIGVDACIMGTVEAAYELRQLTGYYAASMADINIYGWSYNDLFGRMKPGSGGTGA